MLKRIVSHADFDGVVSATICSHVLGIKFLVFTQPRLVSEARLSITSEDVVCDLPYPLECGLWFDHHEGNLDELKYRNIDINNIKGRFEIKDSCARVVFEYFSEKTFPPHFEQMVQEADIIDAFNYKDINDWRAETPGKIIEATTKLKEDSAERKWEYLRNLVRQMRSRPLEEVASMNSVRKRYKLYLEEEDRMLEQIKNEISFLPQDTENKIIIIDLTRHNKRPNVLKQLAYLVFPRAEAVLQVGNIFDNNIKTNDLTFSMSLSLNMNRIEHKKDIGDIMRILNLGGGHPGAAAGTLACLSKDDMLKKKDKIINEIYEIYSHQ